ncbi:MAG: hypothetical protein RR802_05975 [Erysipelotrichaceae bacterium]
MKTLYKLDGTIATNDLLQLSDTESGQTTLAVGNFQYWKKSPDGTLEISGLYTTPSGVNMCKLPFAKTFTQVFSVVTTCYKSNFENVIYNVRNITNTDCEIYYSRSDYGNGFAYIAIGRWK